MLEKIVSFFTRIFQPVGRGLGLAVAYVLKPFVWLGQWFTRRGVILKMVLGVLVLSLVGLYGYFLWTTQRWTNFNPDYAAVYERKTEAPHETPRTEGGIITADEDTKPAETPAQTCRRSLVVDATADLVDFNVNQNAWISSMLIYKLGLFGLPWDKTPFFDNKASFQRGVNQAIRRTTIELVDTLGRVRGTSQIDADLQSARGALQFDEYTWYFSFSPFGPKTPTPSFYRSAIKDSRKFNDRLDKCDAVFDARADNLLQFVDRIAKDIGATSAILRERSENYTAAGSTPAPTTAFGSLTANSTAITASSQPPASTSPTSSSSAGSARYGTSSRGSCAPRSTSSPRLSPTARRPAG